MMKKSQALRRRGDSFPARPGGEEDRAGEHGPEDVCGDIEHCRFSCRRQTPLNSDGYFTPPPRMAGFQLFSTNREHIPPPAMGIVPRPFLRVKRWMALRAPWWCRHRGR